MWRKSLFILLSSLVCSCVKVSVDYSAPGGTPVSFPPPPPPEVETKYVRFNTNTSTRKAVAGRLSEVFLNDATKPVQLISSNAMFGDACNIFDGEGLDNPCYDERDQVRPLFIPFSSLTSGYVTRACYEILSPTSTTMDVDGPVYDSFNEVHLFLESQTVAFKLRPDFNRCDLWEYAGDWDADGDGVNETHYPEDMYTCSIHSGQPQIAALIQRLEPFTGSAIPFPKASSISKAYQWFHVDPAPGNVVSSLQDLANASNTNAEEAWRYIFFTLCASPSWLTQ